MSRSSVFSLAVGRADTRIKTPFQMVPLWSDEMLSYLIGENQAACSGPGASPCERLNTGLCDGSAYFAVTKSRTDVLKLLPPYTRFETDGLDQPSVLPAGDQAGCVSGNLTIFRSPSELDRLDLVFNCNSGGNACPAERFQTGTVRRLELGPIDGKNPVDLTPAASVGPDGPIVVALDQALKESLFSNPGVVYQLRAVAECFSVVPTPAEWKLPLYESPSVKAKSAGALIARVMPGEGMEFTYRPPSGEDVTFDPDWVLPDWGYTFMMDHTVLDRKGDWFQLPPRPFRDTVWIQLAGRAGAESASALGQRSIYTLSKTIKVRSSGMAGAAVFSAGTNIVVVNIRKHALEIRKEEPFDMPCDVETVPEPRRVPTYVVDAAAFYDRLHLQLRPAYPKGC